ncbi:MAG: transcription termination factor NusA [Bacillota bacterium]|nr:transcription termination factor NusA [Bacillota bacterium]
MNSEFIEALKLIVKEKGIKEDLIFSTVEDALVSAYKKNYQQQGTKSEEVKVTMNRETGEIHVYSVRKVATEEEISEDETGSLISVEEAKKINPTYNLGDLIEEEVTPKNFGRVAAQSAKQLVVQRIKEAERNIIYEEFIEKEFDTVTGKVLRKDKGNVFVDLGRIETILGPAEQIPKEEYNFNDRLKFYIVEVKKTTKGPQIVISRTHPGLIKRLFELEVPEIADGTVEIKSISREAGYRTKIAVHSNDENVDAMGACVGPKGVRVQNIVNELKNEKIDIIKWDKLPEKYIANALSPAKVLDVDINEDSKSAKVVVDDNQLSLAIGKEGQNVRLAAKLTGWKIDIKSKSQSEAEKAEN